ncbi:MAG TPA: helix-turn-helix domain-containing protein [Flavobacteriales bacterium]|jgi:AraC-like DNA-binding protein|nr:helix-turn-helix domain-containing protein [Flavobacteriales bacterium]
MREKDILLIKDLAAFEKLINKDGRPYDIDLMVMPGTLEDKHKNVDPELGIPALRRQFNLIYLLLDGEHDVQLGAERRWLKPNDLVIVPESMVYASAHIRACKGYCIHFRTEFMRAAVHTPLASEFPFLDPEAEHIVNVTDEERALLERTFRDIIDEHGRAQQEKDHVLRDLLHILLLRVREIHRPHAQRLRESATRGAVIAAHFKRLVEQHFITERSVARYAEMLYITPKHLADVVKRETGRTPREVIDNTLLLEAKVLLGSTDHTASRIAHELRFTDQSHFGRFIKQHTGLSPAALRAKL